jgi:Zn-dependent protease
MELIQKKPSFHEISPREYMYFPKGTLEMGKPGVFSRLELTHIGLAMIILTICFTFTLSLNNLLWSFLNGFNLVRFQQGFLLSLVAVFCAFFFHEMSHKITAQYYRLWSEFRMNTRSLLISCFLSVITGFVFAAPGKVMFRGKPRRFEEGHIALAGPVANLVLAGLFTPVYLIFFTSAHGMVPQMIGFICLINIIFASFNLLPLKSFDGGKVITYNPYVWTIVMGISICMVAIIAPFIPQLLLTM